MFEEVRDIFNVMKGRVLEDGNSIALVAYNAFGKERARREIRVYFQKGKEWPYRVDAGEEMPHIKWGKTTGIGAICLRITRTDSPATSSP